MTDRICGVVLAGGASRRMGRDKALVTIGGRPLIAWAVERLSPQVGALAISRHDGRLEGVDRSLPLLADGPGEPAGPLAGVLAGLDWAANLDPPATHAVTVAVDTPFLPLDIVDRLAAARATSGTAAAVAASGGRRHPVAALWPVAARASLREALHRDGLRRLGDVLDRLGAAVAHWPVLPVDPFLNVNTPEDLAVAELNLRHAHAGAPARTGGVPPG